MPLNDNERLLVEAIKSLLKQEAELGLSIHKSSTTPEDQQQKLSTNYLHEQINDMFTFKAAELTHAESICQAFHKVHNYKYIDDHTFVKAMDREMASTAVPAMERKKALDFIPSIIEELRTEQNEWAERDSGFNPRLDEIIKSSKPEQPLNFNIESRRLNTKNITTPEIGDGKPAHTSLNQPPLPRDGYDADTEPESDYQ